MSIDQVKGRYDVEDKSYLVGTFAAPWLLLLVAIPHSKKCQDCSATTERIHFPMAPKYVDTPYKITIRPLQRYTFQFVPMLGVVFSGHQRETEKYALRGPRSRLHGIRTHKYSRDLWIHGCVCPDSSVSSKSMQYVIML